MKHALVNISDKNTTTRYQSRTDPFNRVKPISFRVDAESTLESLL